LPSVTVAPFTTELKNTTLIRVPVEPSAENGLQKPSQIMVDKIITMPLAKIGQHVGRLDNATMQEVSRALVVFFALEGAAS
jgi:mRNA interferase MazF